MLRQAYQWVIGWSETPYGSWALFLLAFAESSCFPIPPDVLLISLSVGQPLAAFQFALICSIGSVLGGMAGYTIGLFAFATIGQPILHLYDPDLAVFNQIKGLYDTWGFWGVLAAAITPIPYKVFTIASGVFKFNFLQFVLASIIGRSFRFFVVGGLIYWGGESLKLWIEKYFDWVAWGFLAILILGFAVLKFL
ncbi:MAG: YqaA family protein [Stanieria sp.]|jgi:membrane protein YqaA with SNARE-associated domain